MRSMRGPGALMTGGLMVVLLGRLAAQPAVRLHELDVNRDGRTDRWEYYNEQGTLLRESIDRNFDGRPDIQQWYREGRLVRRELDRNFDDRIDLTNEFDPQTGELTRSVFDVDFDGHADWLVLFSDGKQAFSQWAAAEPGAALAFGTAATPRARRPDEPLRTFEDPFANARRLRSGDLRIPAPAGCGEIRSLPAASPAFAAAGRLATVRAERASVRLSLPVRAFVPRGPPLPA